jgi:hypothetical protein
MRIASTIFLKELFFFFFFFPLFWTVKYSAPHTNATCLAGQVSFVWGKIGKRLPDVSVENA